MTGEVEKFDAKEIEQESLAQAEEATQDPIAMAASMYGLYMPKFKQGIKQLSSRARARVLMALIEYPLEEKKYVHSTQFEKEMMAIGNAVLEAKFLMILSTYNTSPELESALDPSVELTEDEVASILDKSPDDLEGSND